MTIEQKQLVESFLNSIGFLNHFIFNEEFFHYEIDTNNFLSMSLFCNLIIFCNSNEDFYFLVKSNKLVIYYLKIEGVI